MKAKIDTSPEAIFQGLRKIAPDIAFSIYWIENESIKREPEDREQILRAGYREYAVEASALTIFRGEVLEAKNTMTGFFYKRGDLDPDIGGHLPDVLLWAVADLSNQIDFPQAEAAVKYLQKVRKARRS